MDKERTIARMQGYIVIYIEILVLCFLITAIIYSNVSHDLGSEGEIHAFRWFLRLFMTMMVLDAFTQLHYQQVTHPPQLAVAFAYASYMSLLAILAIAWFYFAELQIDSALTRNRAFRIVSVLPGMIVVLLCYASIFNGLIFSFGENGLFVRGPLFFVQNVFAYAYFLFTTIHAFYKSKREASVTRRRRLLSLSAFMIAPVIGAFLQLVIGGYPLIGPSICISILFMFIGVQADLINMDSLTGLNNRKSMERYLDEVITRAGVDEPLYLFMMDADHFKNINDTYGHVEGDRALRLMADALRMTVDQCHGFIARLGGDEFVAIADGIHVGNPDVFSDAVRQNLKLVSEKHHLPYSLTASVGYVKCVSPDTRTADLLKKADEMMYHVKHNCVEA